MSSLSAASALVKAGVNARLSRILTTGRERAADLARLEEIAGEVFGPDRVDVRESLADAVDRAAEIAEAGAQPADRSGVLVFGSVMLAGEMLKLAGRSPR